MRHILSSVIFRSRTFMTIQILVGESECRARRSARKHSTMYHPITRPLVRGSLPRKRLATRNPTALRRPFADRNRPISTPRSALSGAGNFHETLKGRLGSARERTPDAKRPDRRSGRNRWPRRRKSRTLFERFKRREP